MADKPVKIIGLKEALIYFQDVAVNQIPFAVAQALNSTAFAAQSIVRKQLPSRFILRKPWVQRGILVKKATKKKLIAAVYSRDSFMVKQEKGGIHKAKVRRLAIPVDVRSNERKTIPKSKRPRQITRQPKVLITKYSIVKRIGGKKIRRKGSGAAFEKKYKILYRLKRQVRLRPRFGFRDTVEKTVLKVYEKAFNRQLYKALISAKRK